MPAPAQAAKVRIDLSRYEISVHGQRVKLERQLMELLILFGQRQGQLVTREEIVDRLWGKDVFVAKSRYAVSRVQVRAMIFRGMRPNAQFLARMLIGFTPAGQMEDFFTLSSKQPVDAKIAEAHGMKWLGPALDVSKL